MAGLARSDVWAAAVGSSLLLYDSVSTRAHALNASAALVWEECLSASTPEEVVAAVGDLVPDGVSVEADVRTSLDTFASLGLLVADRPGPGPEHPVPLERASVARGAPGEHTTATLGLLATRLAFRSP